MTVAHLPEPDFAHTPEAKQRRLDKAEDLANFMVDHGVAHLPDEAARRDLERGAGVRRCSDETWVLAIEIWRERGARVREAR